MRLKPRVQEKLPKQRMPRKQGGLLSQGLHQQSSRVGCPRQQVSIQGRSWRGCLRPNYPRCLDRTRTRRLPQVRLHLGQMLTPCKRTTTPSSVHVVPCHPFRTGRPTVSSKVRQTPKRTCLVLLLLIPPKLSITECSQPLPASMTCKVAAPAGKRCVPRLKSMVSPYVQLIVSP